MSFKNSVQNATIAAAASLSGAVDLNNYALVGIVVPAGWDAADITLQGSVDGTTFFNVYQDDDSELTIQAAASRYVVVDPRYTYGLQRIKVRSGTAAAPVNQADEVVVRLVLVA